MENKWSTKPGQEWIKCPHCEITFRVRKPSQEGQAGVSADLEAISAKVHEQWMENKRKLGVATRKSESGEELMVPYEQLSEAAKELDRGSVRAVLTAQDALATAPPPVDANVNSQIMVALEESIKLQSHYAGILNNFDGGKRIQFSNAAEWITRMKEIGKLATATPEQADVDDERVWTEAYPEGRVLPPTEEHMPKWQPQPASAGALRELVDSCDLPRAWRAKSPCHGEEECCCHRTCADELTAWIRKILAVDSSALAAHDQKVRREVLEKAADCCDGAQRDKWQGEKAGFTPEQTRLWNKWATELGDEIRALASGAEEKK